jgi:hypothetical protein
MSRRVNGTVLLPEFHARKKQPTIPEHCPAVRRFPRNAVFVCKKLRRHIMLVQTAPAVETERVPALQRSLPVLPTRSAGQYFRGTLLQEFQPLSLGQQIHRPYLGILSVVVGLAPEPLP